MLPLRTRLARVVVILTASLAVGTAAAADTGFAPASGRPFATTSAWNTRISAAPVVDANSARMVGYLSADRVAYADIYEFGDPVFDATSTTRKYTVKCTKRWGVCDLARQRIPIPAKATPAPGSDGGMVVIDWSTRTAYDFWQARRTATGGWEASWGTATRIDGDGRTGSTGAGVFLMAGLVRAYEMRAGVINHALVFGTDNACTTVYRFPATKTDGASARTDCIPEGSRVQLDPTVDVDAIPGITPGERAVAKALQSYGAYVRDNAGAKLAFSFENPSGEFDPYPAAGFGWDYYNMPHIPWDRLRVLREWDGR